MKIALINENSQAAKNGIIEAALKKVVEPMGHEVVNYGMYAADDAAQLTYVQCGILAAVGCCQDQKTLGSIKSVHLCKKLVQPVRAPCWH